MSWYVRAKASKTNQEIDDLPVGKWIPVQSSFITDAAYYEPLGMFEVRLKSGQEYSYKDVPKKVFKNFMSASSKGEFFNRVIKKRYKMK